MNYKKLYDELVDRDYLNASEFIRIFCRDRNIPLDEKIKVFHADKKYCR